MSSFWDVIYCFFKDRGVDPFKDLLLPFLAPDKLLTLIGLIYAIRTFRNTYKLNRVNFIYQLTQSHRDIWSKIHQAKIERILDPNVDVNSITEEERRHIIFIVLNTKISFEAHKAKVYPITKEVQLDVGSFMNLPMPNKVWESIKYYYEIEYVKFVDKCKEDAKGLPRKGLISIFQGTFYTIKNSSLVNSVSNRTRIFLKRRRIRKYKNLKERLKLEHQYRILSEKLKLEQKEKELIEKLKREQQSNSNN